jgi:hypothetical protein
LSTSKLGKKLQIILGIALLLAAVRLFFIYQGRHAAAPPAKSAPQNNLALDDYVVPKKLHAYDLKSAKELIGKTVWVRTGNQVVFYAFDSTKHRADFAKEGGLLAPLQKLEIKDVVLQTVPGGGSKIYGSGESQFRIRDERQDMLAVFVSAASPRLLAAPIGGKRGGSFNILIDEMFFLQDPHDLYNHWPKAIWESVDRHEVTKGMSELQASFALGAGVQHGDGDYGNRTLEFRRGDERVLVTFTGNRASAIVVE